jgi:D-lactate dehydrogenase (cytochrome)
VTANQSGILELLPALRIPLPHYTLPSVKHVGGYFSLAGMDAIDLFIGSEGTLGVFTEIELTLLPRPREILAFVVFFPSEEDSWRFSRKFGSPSCRLHPRILEYFDSGSLQFLRPEFPQIPKRARACLFIEQEVEEKDNVSISDQWHRFFEEGNALDEIWEADTPETRQEFRNFRSALPLAVREFLSEHHQVKIGTDTCVPQEVFEKLMLFHRQKVETLGIPNVTFGHIGENHVHLNLLPRNAEEAKKARALYPEFIKQALALGGTFSAEHGVGKLKRPYLVQLFGEKAVGEMVALKRIFDPNLILGRGNLFEIE